MENLLSRSFQNWMSEMSQRRKICVFFFFLKDEKERDDDDVPISIHTSRSWRRLKNTRVCRSPDNVERWRMRKYWFYFAVLTHARFTYQRHKTVLRVHQMKSTKMIKMIVVEHLCNKSNLHLSSHKHTRTGLTRDCFTTKIHCAAIVSSTSCSHN